MSVDLWVDLCHAPMAEIGEHRFRDFGCQKQTFLRGTLRALYLSQNWVFLILCLIIVKNLFESTNFPNFDQTIFLYRLYLQLQNFCCCLGQIREISIENKHRENFDKFFVQKRDFRGRFHTLVAQFFSAIRCHTPRPN